MFSSYRDFEITIDAIGVASHPMFVRGPGGEARGILASLSGDLTYEALAMRLQHLDIDETALTELGQILFRSVFQGPIKDVYTRSQGELQQGQGLRLKLNIDVHEAAVAALPWEFLHDPDQGPLALLDAPIVRYLPQQAVIPTLETKLPLNVLLTAAQTAPPVNIERELHEVQQSFAQLGSFVQITVEDHLTTAKFQKLLREGNFHIWHFVGHGGFNQNSSTGELAFEDAAGEVQFVSASQLGVLLKRSSVRLVILDACDSARLAINPLMSIAPALIHAQIPAVVAMQFPIPEDATRAFASEFYRALAEGFPIDACVTEGRKAVMNATGLGNPDWGIPVVYTRAQDGMLFDLPPLPKPPCPYPGMAPFVEADSRRFFGRAREIQEMLGSFCQSGSGCGRVQVYHNETGEMMGRYELTDEQYALIEPVLPTNAGKTGHPYDPHRPIINGIFWRLHAGAAWPDIPERYGKWKTIYDRYITWRRDGIWDRILKALQTKLDGQGQIDWEQWALDGTIVRAHRAAAGAEKQGPDGVAEPSNHALGRSVGGFSTKIHLLSDGNGVPLDACLTPGQTHESTQVETVMEQVAIPRASGRIRRRPRRLAADRAYDAQRIRHWLRLRGIKPVIPPKRRTGKRKRGRPTSYDRDQYRQRSAIEQCVGWLKECRAVATRYEKLALNYLGLVKLAFIERYLRLLTRVAVPV